MVPLDTDEYGRWMSAARDALEVARFTTAGVVLAAVERTWEPVWGEATGGGDGRDGDDRPR